MKKVLFILIAVMGWGMSGYGQEGLRITAPNSATGEINYPLQQVSVQKECEKAVYAQIVSEIANNSISIEEKRAWSNAAFGGALTDDNGITYQYPLPSGSFGGIYYIEKYNNDCVAIGCRTDLRFLQNNLQQQNNVQSTGTASIWVETSEKLAESFKESIPMMSGRDLAIVGGSIGGAFAIGFGIAAIVKAVQSKKIEQTQQQQQLDAQIAEEMRIKKEEFLVDAAKTRSTLKGVNSDNEEVSPIPTNSLVLKTNAKLEETKQKETEKEEKCEEKLKQLIQEEEILKELENENN